MQEEKIKTRPESCDTGRDLSARHHRFSRYGLNGRWASVYGKLSPLRATISGDGPAMPPYWKLSYTFTAMEFTSPNLTTSGGIG